MSVKTATVYEPGYVIAGKYELELLLGQGGMGAVWRARNVVLDAPVAIKVVRGTGDRALLRGRLLQEARAAAKLRHPAIVKVFDVGQTESGDPFIVMELLQGDSLGRILEREGRLSSVQAVRTLLPICDALWLSHGKGIVHRDLKPDNVFIVQHEGALQPTLVDFGIVKVQETQGESHLTKDGDVLGSPDYMSPEQARGLEDVGHLSDVWSFTVVLYEAISGRTPFKGANYNALLRQIVEDTPSSLRQLGVADVALSEIVERGLAKQPEQRFADMGELGRALAGWLASQGFGDDICGATLESKWLRPEARTRAGRATMTSITDAWPAEAGSGVRRNELGPMTTIPAPAGGATAPTGALPPAAVETLSELESDLARPPVGLGAGSRRLLLFALLAFGLGALGWLLFRPKPQLAPVSAGQPGPATTTVASSLTALVAESPPAATAPSATTPEAAASAAPNTSAVPKQEPVSSASGRTPAPREVKPAPKKVQHTGSSTRAKPRVESAAPPGDLMSPY